MLDFLLFLFAAVCFGLAAFRILAGRVELVALGLCLFAIPFVLHAVPG